MIIMTTCKVFQSLFRPKKFGKEVAQLSGEKPRNLFCNLKLRYLANRIPVIAPIKICKGGHLVSHLFVRVRIL